MLNWAITFLIVALIAAVRIMQIVIGRNGETGFSHAHSARTLPPARRQPRN